ncbi:alpha-L-rhamnosidase [Lewinella sp. IMCC34183]|uniref:alpha-L-rhamnosidase n=1 Tax=Lewinella sp. IMCC34183 TaxID=2248762 RepID=UPI000E2870C3|nr:alpha-L-rhamnosidase [Lewinella sp. IMCC34183]
MPTNLPPRPRSHASSLLFILFLLLLFGFWSRLVAQEVTGLEVEYTTTPLGIDVNAPRFAWQLVQPEGARGLQQEAYRITVTDPGGKTVWNSGRVPGGTALGIPYAGTRLAPKTRYRWEVTAYGNGGEELRGASWFETGLLDPSERAWGGAEWIGGGDDDLPLQSNYLSVFRVAYTLQLDRATGSQRASFLWGGNDVRLLDRYMNLYGLENAPDSSYLRLEYDVSGSRPALHVYRVGYAPDDRADRPLLTLPIPDSVIAGGGLYAPHQVEIASVFGNTRIRIDGVEIGTDHERYYNGGWGRGGHALNPIGTSDVIGYPMLADIGFHVPAGQSATFSGLTVSHFRAPANAIWWADGALFAGTDDVDWMGEGYRVSGGNAGTFVLADPSRKAMPMLRKEFSAGTGGIDRARLYVTARGVYEVYLNGERVGEDYFNPGLTQYDRTQLYQTYDVTDRIRSGENALGAWLGEGWWSGNSSFSGLNWNYFGDRQSLLALLEITYADGTTTIVTTDDSWSYYDEGPVRYGSFFQGEVYDAEREATVAGWLTAGYAAAGWTPAEVVPLEGTAYLGENSGRPVDYSRTELIGQIGDNARVVQELTARSVEEVRPGVFVYDMGTNMVGVPRIDFGGLEAGQNIWLRYAEVLYPDLPEYGDKVGMIMIENLRAALAHDHYIARAGENVYQPRFTFHGYRYLEITGIEAALPPEAVKGLVISSVHEVAADYTTSNDHVNQLFHNIVRSQYGNFLSIPTDCPQRNERMGWSGDLSVFARTATYFSDADQFFRRHLLAMRNTQYADGHFADVAPAADGFGGILWGSAGLTVAWESWQQYGDTSLLREHYPAMRAYMDFLRGGIDEKTGVMTAGVLGDWLSPEGNQNDNTLLWESYYIFDLQIMEAVARVLGHTDAAEAYAAQLADRRRHFAATYLEPTTGRTMRSGYDQLADAGPDYIGTQVSYALPVALGAVTGATADTLAARLAELVKSGKEDDGGVVRPPYSLMTGFIGTAWISKALSDHGYSDVAYRLLLQEKYPSWLYPVTQGATSIWERLNSYTIEDGFGNNNSMNSFNHYSFGAVGQWMIAHSLGIQRGAPGFKSFVLRPEPDPSGQLTEASGYYDSPYGRIRAAWKVEGKNLTYTVTVPANTSARLELPASSAKAVSGDAPVTEYRDGRAIVNLSSGTYTFRAGQ